MGAGDDARLRWGDDQAGCHVGPETLRGRGSHALGRHKAEVHLLLLPPSGPPPPEGPPQIIDPGSKRSRLAARLYSDTSATLNARESRHAWRRCSRLIWMSPDS